MIRYGGNPLGNNSIRIIIITSNNTNIAIIINKSYLINMVS